MKLILAALICVALAAGFAMPALANVPDRNMSDISSCNVSCPAGDITFLCTIRQFNGNPSRDTPVQLDFCGCPDFHLATEGSPPYVIDPSGCKVSRLTDASGHADFPLAAGGPCADFAVKVDVVFTVNRAMKSIDQNGDLAVDQTDLDLAEAKIGTSDMSADFDCDAAVTAEDVDLIRAHMGHGAFSPVSVPALVTGGELSLARPPAPNPSRGRVGFVVANPHEQDVEVAIFDLFGRRVTTLWSGRLSAGEIPFRWDGIAASGERARAGLYAVRLRAGAARATKLFTLLR